MKKISLMVVVCMVLTLLCGCGNGSKPVLKIYNAGKYIDMSVLDEFEEKYGCEIVYDEFDSNESMYVQIANDSYTYDVVVPSDYYIDRLIQEGRVEKLDKSVIKNIANIKEEYLKPVYDPENDYTIPYMVGTLGILYNKSKLGIDEKDISFDILFDKKYSGQIFMLDSMRDALGAALVKLGYSVNTSSDKEIEEAKNLLISQKPIIQALITDEMVDKMIAEEGLLTLAYSGEAAYAMAESKDLSYAVPKEGSNKWVDGFVVLKNGKQKDLAMKFIDFMCQPDIAQRNMDESGYASPVINTQAGDDRGTEVYYPSDETLSKCEAFTYSEENTKKYYKAWEEYKIAN
ncbi:MAG: spermidine/putrescine ABC transporter substrate-binding protein [Clostridia bacterium]|nr:spermidine/putrescine ABC transporter substrate-binding protein [Clostridia bacterium]